MNSIKQEPKHTALPWRFEPHPADRTVVILGPIPAERFIAELSPQSALGQQEVDANAAKIVQCVNNFDQVVAALNRLCKIGEHIELSQGLRLDRLFESEFRQARQALSQSASACST